jgi:hypothetical protein
MPKRLTKEDFINKAIEIHGNKYDYSLVDYKTNKSFVKIICPKHGVFEQRPINHLQGCGCPYCSGTKRLTTQEFIERSKQIHGDKYDYSVTQYVNNDTKVNIICPIHGIFSVKPSSHLKGYGCKECSKENRKDKINSKANINSRFKRFVDKANKVHHNKYDYSQADYKNVFEKIKIICPEHGEFFQVPQEHLKGRGCPKCANISHGNKMRKPVETFIEQARIIHGNKYDYSKMNYVNNFTNIEIVCPEHGSFFQTPKEHLKGNGCHKCSSSISEKDIFNLLERNNIKFETQKKFDWLKYKNNMSLDFYLPDYNIAIECQGRQHFEIIDRFGGSKGYKLILERDTLKRELCDQHGIKVLYYANYKYKFPYKVYTSKTELINDIMKIDQI